MTKPEVHCTLERLPIRTAHRTLTLGYTYLDLLSWRPSLVSSKPFFFLPVSTSSLQQRTISPFSAASHAPSAAAPRLLRNFRDHRQSPSSRLHPAPRCIFASSHLHISGVAIVHQHPSLFTSRPAPKKKITATMPAKRKLVAEANIEPASVPSSLPPSVEEAYRRKCLQLKNRTNEVEDANDAARLRLARIKRQVEKLRIERAFLLEQLAKRTSTNVEDSEGSPSPPPTVCFLKQNSLCVLLILLFWLRLFSLPILPISLDSIALSRLLPFSKIWLSPPAKHLFSVLIFECN